MACGSCATGGCSTAGGCGSSGGCQSGSCNKMNSFDWLGNMSLPGVDMFDVVEIRFKGGRKEFFRNNQRLFLMAGEPVVIEMPNGHHIGYVALQGELVRLQLKKKKTNEDSVTQVIYRKATPKDLERYEEVKKREMPTMFRTRQIISDLHLKMKLSDVEYQADNTKATFYYSADERVDFRELIKLLAGEFKVRVEMRQISLRQEASRVGGIGSCGRELCCSTWLSDFRTVSTSAARYQNLSLNPTKLSGQCGRLKCCLNYELETYQDALLDIPEIKQPLITEQGEAQLQKVDIFKKILWFSVGDDNNWYPVEVARVLLIIDANKRGLMPTTIMSAEMMGSKEYKSQTATEGRRTSTTSHISRAAGANPDDLVPIKGTTAVPRRASKPDADLKELERLEAMERQEAGIVAEENASRSGDAAKRNQRNNGNQRRPNRPEDSANEPRSNNSRNEPREGNRDSRNRPPRTPHAPKIADAAPELPAKEGDSPEAKNNSRENSRNNGRNQPENRNGGRNQRPNTPKDPAKDPTKDVRKDAPKEPLKVPPVAGTPPSNEDPKPKNRRRSNRNRKPPNAGGTPPKE